MVISYKPYENISDISIRSNVSSEETRANREPVADLVLGQNVIFGTTVELDGRKNSDANGEALTYSWTLISNLTIAQLQLDPPLSRLIRLVL